MDSHSSDAFRLSSAARVQARTQRPLPLTAGMKARQFSKSENWVRRLNPRGCLHLAYMAAAGVNAVSSLHGFQSKNCRYARKPSPLSFRSTTESPVRTARGPGSSQTADPALRS
jgi:hypothetical protein